MLKLFAVGVLMSGQLACYAASSTADYVLPHATEPLHVGKAIAGDIKAGELRPLVLTTQAGHVVQGTFTGDDVALDVVDKQGKHLRRLAFGDGLRKPIMWVATADAESLVLRAPAQKTGSFELIVSRSLPPVAPVLNDMRSASEPELLSPRLIALKQSLTLGATTDEFWRTIQQEGTPLVEPIDEKRSRITFLWRGARDNVRLFGAPSGNHESLFQLGDSDVWWRSFEVSNETRLSYRLAPDVPAIAGSAMDNRRMILATAQRDPLNPRRFPESDKVNVDVFQGSSVVTLPSAPEQLWVEKRPSVSSGTLTRTRFQSAILNNDRDVWTYVPAGQRPSALLVLFDANAYLERVPTPRIIDNLISDGLIPSTAVVLIENASPEARGRELPPNDAFATFLNKELMPWIVDQGLGQPAATTIVAGSSYGGLAAAYAGLTNASWFGGVLSLSGSYWWGKEKGEPQWLTHRYAQAPRKDVRFYIDAGRYEVGRGETPGIFETSQLFADTLRRKGYDVVQAKHDSAHDYLHWQGSLACGLVALLNPVAWESLGACSRV